jgi:hypothetical protein
MGEGFERIDDNGITRLHIADARPFSGVAYTVKSLKLVVRLKHGVEVPNEQ